MCIKKYQFELLHSNNNNKKRGKYKKKQNYMNTNAVLLNKFDIISNVY